MKTELIDHSPTRKELRIEIDADEVRRQYDQVTQRYMKHATVPGFRPGRAPQGIVRQRFKDEIRSEVVREVVPAALQQAITEENLDVLGEPDIQLGNEEGLEKLGDVPLSVHAQLEVFPVVEVGDYKGLEVARRVRPVGDADVELMIEGLRESAATLAPVEDRAAQEGDTVTVNFRGRFRDEPEAEEIKADDVDVVIGGEGVLTEFNENLTGTRDDDERTFAISYPEDFSSKGLAGKTVDYTAKVVAVRHKELPELDDEFAKTLDEEDIKTMDDLRRRIRESLEERATVEADATVQGALMEQLVNAHQFEVPQSLVQMQTRRLLEQTVREMYSRGMDPRGGEYDWANMRTNIEQQAITDLRGSMLLDRIADEEGLEVSDEEIETEIHRIATASRKSVDEVRDALTKQGGDRSIADRLRNRKAIDLLVSNAKIREEEWREEEEESVATAAEPIDDTAGDAPKAEEAGA